MSRRVAVPVAAFFVFGGFWSACAALLPELWRATGTTDAEFGLALPVVAVAASPAMLLADRLARAHQSAEGRLRILQPLEDFNTHIAITAEVA